MPRRVLPLALTLLLAACGTLPQPFYGNPGRTGAQLAQLPMPPRLVVPPPATALLSDDGSKALAALLARDLQLREVPAYAEPGHPGDWRLDVTAETRGGVVIPSFVVRTPKGADAGRLEGAPVPAAAWAAGTPATLEQVAASATPGLATMLSGINTALQRSDPNSIYNRPIRLAFLPVTGAPGDGDAALTRLTRARLTELGEHLQDSAKDADFTVKGQVRVVPIGGGQERVEIQWILTDAQGRERGRVVQLNDVPAGSLDGYWGDVADAVSRQAAGGVRELVRKQTKG
ncbi:MAG TPA: hypothetical protein VFA03_04155 [Acetobacteraceae bacterium]|nr:hypothetical protein [Acetobacteraceae bacterium]